MIFPPNFNGTEMFWIVSNDHAYGGRSALLPLLVLMIKGTFKAVIKNKILHNQSIPGQCFDNFTCNDNKFKLKRLVNLLRRGKKLKVNFARSLNEWYFSSKIKIKILRNILHPMITGWK